MTLIRTRLVPIVALLVLFVAACGGDGSDVDVSEVDAAELLRSAAERMDAVERFHFELDHENGYTEIVRGLQMQRAEGDVAGVDRMRTEVRASVGPLNVDVGIVILPDESWIQNPLTGNWERESISIESILNPSEGVTALMRSIAEQAIEQGAEVTGTGRVSGVEAYTVEAEVRSDDLDDLVAGASAGLTLRATAWIGVDDPLVHRLELRGAASPNESDDLVRILTLSDFDGDIVIEPPR
jgi:hypothetical protein